jgi:hypothetical protein
LCLELKTRTENRDTILRMIFSIGLAVVLSVLVTVLFIRRLHHLCTVKAAALRNNTAPNESNVFPNGLSDEMLDNILASYDNSLEVNQADYVTCKSN